MNLKLTRNRKAFLASLDLTTQDQKQIEEIWFRYETEMHRYINNNGSRYTLGRYKECYEFLRNKILLLPTQPLVFCQVDKKGLPKPLWSLRPLLKRDRKFQRIALTIARSFEKIRLPIDYSKLEVITDVNSDEVQSNISDLTQDLNQFLEKFSKKFSWWLGSQTDPIAPWSKVLTTLSKGPNGPAVACSHLDAVAIKRDKDLHINLKNLNDALQQSWITDWMEGQSGTIQTEKILHTGRLGFSSEAGGKTRIFAIGDYWTQLSLKPIQIRLYNTLKSIAMDSTANQDKGFKTLIKESHGKETYCFDLTSASDRIPALMQVKRMELMYNKTIADSWYHVMTQRSFFIKPLKKSIRWNVGQPLGLLSSFPSFALWHHDIVQLAANWDNLKKDKPLFLFKKYRLLGDDIVIYDKKTAVRYQWLLGKIGVKINLTKSIIGSEDHSQIEFTKRLSLDGMEMSSVKNNILSKNHIIDMLDLVEHMFKTSFITADTGYCNLSSLLNKRERQLLQFLIWLRVSDAPSLDLSDQDGNASLILNREDVMQSITNERARLVIEKAEKVESLDMETEFGQLVKLFDSLSVPYSKAALADRSIGDLSGSHPTVLALTQTSRELQFLRLTLLDELDPECIPPVEYLPVVTSRSYFSSRTDSCRYLSKILNKVFTDYVKED